MRLTFTQLKLSVILVITFMCCLSHVVAEKSPSALTVVDSPETTLEDEDVFDEDGEAEDLDVVQPTHLWQTLGPGQAVPRGSHVRLNLQTGQREVRLGEEQLKYLGEKYSQGKQGSLDPQSFSTQELKEALKNFKEGVEPKTTEEEEREKELRSKFRPLEELKRDMAKLDTLVETDAQVMGRLVAQFNSSSASLEERLKALLELEYLVHQVDNAQNLASMGGLKLVVDSLNSSDHRLQENAAFVLGSALSSNPVVQVEAVESGALQKLLTLLATSRPMTVKKKVLFAVAALLRHFPFAQSHFLKLGGLQVLGELFRSAAGGGALKVRVVTLLYDMIMEKELMTQKGLYVPDSAHQERLRQYAQISVLPLLVEQGWCSLVPELLESPEHDWREKALRALLAMLGACQDRFREDRGLGTTLRALREQYQELVVTETTLGDEDGYFMEILNLLDMLAVQLK